MSLDINNSFLIDVGFQGEIIHDIREATGTKDNDDALLVESDLEINPEIKGFYKGITQPEWDTNIKTGHFIENLPKTVLPIDELPPVGGGRLPQYKSAHDDQEVFLAQMTYRYFKELLKNSINPDPRIDQ